jgi:hypothetical protein
MVWVVCEFKKNTGSKVNSMVCRFCTEDKCKVAKTLPVERVAKQDKKKKKLGG